MDVAYIIYLCVLECGCVVFARDSVKRNSESQNMKEVHYEVNILKRFRLEHFIH